MLVTGLVCPAAMQMQTALVLWVPAALKEVELTTAWPCQVQLLSQSCRAAVTGSVCLAELSTPVPCNPPDLHPCPPSVLLQAEAAASAEAGAGPEEDADWLLAEVEAGVAMVDVQPDVLREQLEQLFPTMAE